jgi:hypothetical protein
VVAPKTYFGRYELRDLLDYYEWINAISVELSEQHELAWVLGCVCGIRPCSLVEAHLRKGDFLRWGDIQPSRATTGDGMSIPIPPLL